MADEGKSRYHLREQLDRIKDEELVALAATHDWQQLGVRFGATGSAVRKRYVKRGLLERVQQARDVPVEQRQKAERAGADVSAAGGVVVSPVVRWDDVPSPVALCEKFGVPLGDWIIDRQVLNTWGPLENPCFQLKLWLSPKVVAEWPLVPVKLGKPVTRRVVKRADEVERTVILSDPHCPYHEPKLDACIEQMLRDRPPHRIIVNGDGMDLPTLSRHKRNPAYAAEPQECLDSFGEWLERKRNAAPDAVIQILLGNHDQRLRDYMLERAAGAYGLTPRSMRGAPPESLADMYRRLLELDELGVELVAPANDGEYHRAEVRLAPKLGVRHGKRTGKLAAQKTSERIGYSIAGGHTHIKETLFQTTWDEDGNAAVRLVIGTGCLCIIEDGLGYTDEERPNWQQGAASVSVHPSGLFNVEHILWVNDSLLWRDGVWT